MHEAAAYRCKIASQDVSSVSLEPEELEAALVELRVAQGESEWWEAFLESAQDSGDMVKALVTEVPLGEAEPIAAEQFLQTRTTVGVDEADGSLNPGLSRGWTKFEPWR